MRKFFWVLLLIIMVAFIFYNSSLPAAQSNGASSLLASYVAGIAKMLHISLPAGNLNYNIRKFAHLFEFFMLGIILCNTYSEFHVAKRTANGYIFFLSLAVAVADEYIQLFSAGRSSLVTDVVLDFGGAFVAWLAYEVWLWCKH
jgi:VanZ family protein